jgi:hypothetical protein
MDRLDLLDDAYAKLDRAAEHLEELEAEVREFRESDPYEVSGEADADSGDYVLRVRTDKPPRKISAVVGDVVNNLRPPLDYLISALATLDSGKAHPSNQFPICDAPAAFKAELTEKRRLHGLTADHVTAIEKLQPYSRRKTKRWLRDLRDLSNPDKHVRLNVLAGYVEGEFDFEDPDAPAPITASTAKPTVSPFPAFSPSSGQFLSEGGVSGILTTGEKISDFGSVWSGNPIPATQWWSLAGSDPVLHTTSASIADSATYLQAQPVAPQSKVDVYLTVSIFVTFPDGSPVIETMEILHSQVAKTIKAFEREFK